MAPLNPAVSPKDAKAITDAQTKFFDSRVGMIAGLNKKHQSQWRCAVIVDAIIQGTVTHFVEVARDQVNHAEELKQWGNGNFGAFVSNWTDSIILLFQKDIAP